MRRIRICILGVAHVHTPTYMRCLQRNPGADFLGIYDDVTERAQAYSQTHSVRAFADMHELMEYKPEVALICSENANHEKWVCLAAEYGMDILCEKPLGINTASMQRMLDVCCKKGVKLMTAMCNRYIHSFQEAAQAVRAGKIGELIAVFATNKGTMPGGWFTDPALSGGGCVIDHTVHVADLMNQMLGTPPEWVHAIKGHHLFEMEAEDCALITMGYSGNVLVSLDASWSRTPYFPYGRDLTLRFVGTKGSIFVDYFAENNRVYAPEQRAYSYYGEDKDQMMLDDLVRCYQTGQNYPITGEDGMKCAMVAEAAYRSITSGCTVALEKVKLC